MCRVAGVVILTAIGIDMMIEYTYQTFDKKMVEIGLAGLDFELNGRKQFYSEPYMDLQY